MLIPGIPRAAALALIEAIEPLEGLGAGGFFRYGLFCAMGALGYRGLVRHGLMEEDEGILTDRGTDVALINDANPDETPAERKDRVLAWLREMVEE